MNGNSADERDGNVPTTAKEKYHPIDSHRDDIIEKKSEPEQEEPDWNETEDKEMPQELIDEEMERKREEKEKK